MNKSTSYLSPLIPIKPSVYSPLVDKIEVTKRSKVRRKYLSYMRELSGKAARLTGVDFDKRAVNTLKEVPVMTTDNTDETSSDVETTGEAQA